MVSWYIKKVFRSNGEKVKIGFYSYCMTWLWYDAILGDNLGKEILHSTIDKNFPFFLAIFVRSMYGKKYPAEKKQTTISENTHKSSMCKL